MKKLPNEAQVKFTIAPEGFDAAGNQLEVPPLKGSKDDPPRSAVPPSPLACHVVSCHIRWKLKGPVM